LYLRLIDFVHHSTIGLRVIKKRRRTGQTGPKEPNFHGVALPHTTLFFYKHQTFHFRGIATKSAKGVSLSDEGARGTKTPREALPDTSQECERGKF